MRTEEEVLKDFEKLDWKVLENSNYFLILTYKEMARINLNKQGKTYYLCGIMNMQEHKLLTELFQIWGWI